LGREKLWWATRLTVKLKKGVWGDPKKGKRKNNRSNQPTQNEIVIVMKAGFVGEKAKDLVHEH